MQRRMKFLVPAVAATMAATSAGTIAATGTSDGAGSGEEVTLTMGSWRSDDVEQMETLLAAFHEEHPNITVSFEPTIPHRVRRRPADRARDGQRPGSLLRAVVRERSCALRGGVHLPAHRPRPRRRRSARPASTPGPTTASPTACPSSPRRTASTTTPTSSPSTASKCRPRGTSCSPLPPPSTRPASRRSPTRRVTNGRWPN